MRRVGVGEPATAADLRLQPVRLEDEVVAMAAHADRRWGSFVFLLGLQPGMAWSEYVQRLDDDRLGRALSPDRVPSTFLLAWLGGTLVGRASIRHELDDALLLDGGHIGYGVLPSHRGSGIATEILRQSLVVARSLGVTDALLTCDRDNTASARVIERCGGRPDHDDGTAEAVVRRYWIH